MPKWRKDKPHNGEFRGGDDGCYLCDGEKLPWREGMFCIICDNRDDGDATWFQQFVEYEAGG